MMLKVRYFAAFREALGSSENLDIADGATVGSVRDALIARGGSYAEVLARGRAVRAALDKTLCNEAVVVRADSELAFFPPVTGG